MGTQIDVTANYAAGSTMPLVVAGGRCDAEGAVCR
jgi:hypothetical protein